MSMKRLILASAFILALSLASFGQVDLGTDIAWKWGRIAEGMNQPVSAESRLQALNKMTIPDIHTLQYCANRTTSLERMAALANREATIGLLAYVQATATQVRKANARDFESNIAALIKLRDRVSMSDAYGNFVLACAMTDLIGELILERLHNTVDETPVLGLLAERNREAAIFSGESMLKAIEIELDRQFDRPSDKVTMRGFSEEVARARQALLNAKVLIEHSMPNYGLWPKLSSVDAEGTIACLAWAARTTDASLVLTKFKMERGKLPQTREEASAATSQVQDTGRLLLLHRVPVRVDRTTERLEVLIDNFSAQWSGVIQDAHEIPE